MNPLEQHLEQQRTFAHAVPGLNSVAPGREILERIRKTLPDGRIFEWVYEQCTYATPEMVYQTKQLISAPKLDCPCTPLGPEDVTFCYKCSAAVCAKYHGATCHCGLTFCSCCLYPITKNGVQALVCKACAKDLKASWLGRAIRGTWRLVFVRRRGGCKWRDIKSE